MILGIIVIIVVGSLVLNYFKAKREGEIIPPIDIAGALPTTHTVAKGEDLWKISENYYGVGYNWVDISEENNITDPNRLEVGHVLTIPDVSPRIAQKDTTQTPTTTSTPDRDEPTTITDNGKTIHVVSIGDTLWSIAERYFDSGFNWLDIAKENNITKPNLIEVDQQIFIPSVQPKASTVQIIKGASSQEPISGATYEVQKGDHLWGISVRAYGDGYKWTSISKENDLLNPNLIHAGNRLSLPR